MLIQERSFPEVNLKTIFPRHRACSWCANEWGARFDSRDIKEFDYTCAFKHSCQATLATPKAILMVTVKTMKGLLNHINDLYVAIKLSLATNPWYNNCSAEGKVHDRQTVY